MYPRTLLLSVWATAAATVSAIPYHLLIDHSGSSFFDGWNFIEGPDINDTSSWVDFQSQQDAVAKQLAFLNGAGNIVLKVDNVTNGGGDPTFNRSSIEITSRETIVPGNLAVMDAVHLPFGCSTWPAFWTEGSVWPDSGEVDIIENVNDAQFNRYALHTLNGCQHPDDSSIETGILQSTDCFNQTNHDQGCLVQDPSPNSYGPPFAANGGGAFALLWDDYGMRIWFFERPSIPADLTNGTPDPDGWGLPTAAYPQTSCDFSQFFTKQSLVIDINICGRFVNNHFSDCIAPGIAQCTDMTSNPSNYDDAYWEISYVRVFTNDSSLIPTTTTSSLASITGTVTVTTMATSTKTSSKNRASQSFATTIVTMIAMVALPVFTALIMMAW